jgi:hypothetical protein
MDTSKQYCVQQLIEELNMFKKALAIVILMSSTSAFAGIAMEITSEYALPPEMEGCKIFYLHGGGFSYQSLYVTKCPTGKTETSFKIGKSKTTVLSADPDVPVIQDSPTQTAPEKPVVIEYNGSKYVKVAD